MEKLQELEINRLVTQLNYKQTDFDYRQELLNQADIQFHKTVSLILNDYPELKSIYDSKQEIINESIEKIVHRDEEEIETTTPQNDIEISDLARSDWENEEDNGNPKLKHLHREIVKVTHPDKIRSHHLNDLYLLATDYYEDGDILNLTLLAYRLNIPINWDSEDLEMLSNRIEFYKQKLFFMESTYTWRWFSSNDDKEKREILLGYVRSKII